MGTVTIDIHQQLIERCKSGDASAQEELYQRYAKNMLNTSFRILGSRADAEDVLQDSFIEAFTRLNDYRAEATFGAWLKRIVVNKSISLIRKRKFEFLEENMDDQELADAVHDFDFITDEEQTILYIKKGISELPEGYRIVLSLYLIEGYDHVEIAQILKISESTSKTQYLRAKAKLKNWMQCSIHQHKIIS